MMRWLLAGFLLVVAFGLIGFIIVLLRGALLLAIDPDFRWRRFFYWLFFGMTAAWAALCWWGLGRVPAGGTALFVFAPAVIVLFLGGVVHNARSEAGKG